VEIRKVLVDQQGEGERLDVVLARLWPDLSRSRLSRLIEKGLVLVDGRRRKPGARVQQGENIEIRIPAEPEFRLEPQNIPLDIIYEDSELAVINKPQGMVVHPAHGIRDGTLAHALLYHFEHLSQVAGAHRPGIVHRLDRDTSGLLVVAKNDDVHQHLSAQLQERVMKREYIALVQGGLESEAGIIEAPISRNPQNRTKMAVVRNGRLAVTHYTVLQRYRGYTLVRVRLETGRTHQIRVHFAYIGSPVVGDTVYGPPETEFDLAGQLLHASYISFQHPVSGEVMEFESPLPQYFERVLKTLDSRKSLT
jgi:23S rRNA pseudouridine1911/1915/1917 synthase